MNRTTPFDLSHHQAIRLGAAARSGRRTLHHDYLFGVRAVRRPLLALMVKRELGPCRHALQQRTVAGTMVVHLPFGKRAPTQGPTTSLFPGEPPVPAP